MSVCCQGGWHSLQNSMWKCGGHIMTLVDSLWCSHSHRTSRRSAVPPVTTRLSHRIVPFNLTAATMACSDNVRQQKSPSIPCRYMHSTQPVSLPPKLQLWAELLEICNQRIYIHCYATANRPQRWLIKLLWVIYGLTLAYTTSHDNWHLHRPLNVCKWEKGIRTTKGDIALCPPILEGDGCWCIRQHKGAVYAPGSLGQSYVPHW